MKRGDTQRDNIGKRLKLMWLKIHYFFNKINDYSKDQKSQTMVTHSYKP